MENKDELKEQIIRCKSAEMYALWQVHSHLSVIRRDGIPSAPIRVYGRKRRH